MDHQDRVTSVLAALARSESTSTVRLKCVFVVDDTRHYLALCALFCHTVVTVDSGDNICKCELTDLQTHDVKNCKNKILFLLCYILFPKNSFLLVSFSIIVFAFLINGHN